MSRLERFEADQRAWLAQQIASIPDEFVVLKPSEWAEARRYVPAQNSPLPGPYRFDVTPYWREVVDCLSVDSPIREIAVMKGVQVGATVGILENAIGYAIEHVRTAPVMLVTADRELAKNRIDSFVIPMLDASHMMHLIKSADEGNRRKTGKTDQKLEWEGGGFLIPLGAQNANKLRSIPIEWLLGDEIDGWPLMVGKDGDPMKLVRDRTAAFETSRKIVNLSTPTIAGQSKIAEAYERGDQRQYFVCCLQCGFPQVLRWRTQVNETGEVGGIMWETERGRLIHDSVRYVCVNCGHEHQNADKIRLLSPDHGAEWRPTAESASAHVRSYHLSALYSPVGMQTWAECVEKWLQAWDVENNRMLDSGKLQVFYNNVLGRPYEPKGERVRLEIVSGHRRAAYKFGQIPNRFAEEHCGGPVVLLTCAVDVHKDSLPVAVFGWCRERRPILIDYWRFEGNTEQLDDPGTWMRLAELLEQKIYKADDGRRYKIQLTLVDSGYRLDQAHDFCGGYSVGVYPVLGRQMPVGNSRVMEFSQFETAKGGTAFMVTVDIYKDRLSAALRREWSGQGLQPYGHFNAPADVTEKQLRELTVETKLPKPGSKGGYEWRRPSGAANELWDLLVYNSAGLDIIAQNVCESRGLDAVDWPFFWEVLTNEQIFIEP